MKPFAMPYKTAARSQRKRSVGSSERFLAPDMTKLATQDMAQNWQAYVPANNQSECNAWLTGQTLEDAFEQMHSQVRRNFKTISAPAHSLHRAPTSSTFACNWVTSRRHGCISRNYDKPFRVVIELQTPNGAIGISFNKRVSISKDIISDP